MRKQINTINESIKDRTAQSIVKEIEDFGYFEGKREDFIITGGFVQKKDFHLRCNLNIQQKFEEHLRELYGDDLTVVKLPDSASKIFCISREVGHTPIYKYNSKDDEELKSMGDTLSKRG